MKIDMSGEFSRSHYHTEKHWLAKGVLYTLL